MVNSRCVAGLSTGMRAFSASNTIVNATAVKARLGIERERLRGKAFGDDRQCGGGEVSDTTKITTSSAGSARKPIIISRRAPSVPKAVPTSIAARDTNTRAVASRPTSAIASAAWRERQTGGNRGDDRGGGHHGAEDHVRARAGTAARRSRRSPHPCETAFGFRGRAAECWGRTYSATRRGTDSPSRRTRAPRRQRQARCPSLARSSRIRS